MSKDNLDYPYGEFDAAIWAKEFIKYWSPTVMPTEDDMRTWFANAIMTGYDKAKREGKDRPHITDGSPCWCDFSIEEV